ncbi:MAG: hypothetical protein LLG06_03660 [Desulfobacteraceae bacterium]|nr:hypothetical protein [Desulfobacteraceae bacterium]
MAHKDCPHRLFHWWWRTLVIVAMPFVMAGQLRAEDLVFRSQCCTIHYSTPSQLENFAGKMRAGAVNRTVNHILAGKGRRSDQANLEETIDALFKRVQLILDMPMPKLRVTIQIHRDEKAVAEEFARITGETTSAPSFYWKRTNTIHVQTDHFTVGMLAHEMGHAIIDHFFAVQPPAKIAEMLCQYVDREVSSGASEKGRQPALTSHSR